MYWDCYKLWSVGDICYGFVHRSDTAEFISLAVCWQAASVGSRWSAFLDELSRSQRVSLFSPYTGWSKSICAPALIVFEQSPHTTDDFKMVITEYVRNVDRAVLNTVFEDTVRRVNKYLENVPVDALNITCNFLYCNHQVHRDFLSTLCNEYCSRMLWSPVFNLVRNMYTKFAAFPPVTCPSIKSWVLNKASHNCKGMHCNSRTHFSKMVPFARLPNVCLALRKEALSSNSSYILFSVRQI